MFGLSFAFFCRFFRNLGFGLLFFWCGFFEHFFRDFDSADFNFWRVLRNKFKYYLCVSISFTRRYGKYYMNYKFYGFNSILKYNFSRSRTQFVRQVRKFCCIKTTLGTGIKSKILSVKKKLVRQMRKILSVKRN